MRELEWRASILRAATGAGSTRRTMSLDMHMLSCGVKKLSSRPHVTPFQLTFFICQFEQCQQCIFETFKQ